MSRDLPKDENYACIWRYFSSLPTECPQMWLQMVAAHSAQGMFILQMLHLMQIHKFIP